MYQDSDEDMDGNGDDEVIHRLDDENEDDNSEKDAWNEVSANGSRVAMILRCVSPPLNLFSLYALPPPPPPFFHDSNRLRLPKYLC